MEIKIAFTDKEITSWSKTLKLKKMLYKMNIDEQLGRLAERAISPETPDLPQK